MSVQIAQERKGYYAALERVQASAMDVTGWVEWFLGGHLRATQWAGARVTALTREAMFWRRHAATPLSARQRQVLARVLKGFEGRLTVRKWAALGKCSVEQAQRDAEELLACGVLDQDPKSGRRVAYRIR
jgi:Fic family protein